MRGLILSICLHLFIWPIFVECSDVRRTPVVQTKSGPIRGFISTTVWNSIEYSSFKGIPYATPPIGKLRFKPPIPPEPWNEIRDTIEEASICPQLDYHGVYLGNEDCLHLSVFTPTTNLSETLDLKPVMVWFFGGAFIRGHCNSSTYGPDFFMEQDVVLVTFNHRLGALGYLYLDDPRVPGNAALKDEIMVLEWVRDNIAAFGGDPNNITIFGESSGSVEVTCHVLSNRSTGLFHRAIAQSGTALSFLYMSTDRALTTAYTLANKMGFRSVDSKELSEFYVDADARDLVEQTNALSLLIPFGPVKETIYEEELPFLTECPVTIATTKSFNKVPMMLGFTRDEGLLFAGGFYEFINRTIEQLDQLPVATIDYFYNIPKQIALVTSDFAMKAQIDFTQRMFVQGNGDHPIYYYHLSRESNYSIHSLFGIPVSGATHADDVGYLFHAQSLRAPVDPEHPFNQFRRKMVTMWANFARYGNPTPEDTKESDLNVVWEPSGKAGRMLNIDEVPRMIERDKAINQLAIWTERAIYFFEPVTTSCEHIVYADYNDLFPRSV